MNPYEILQVKTGSSAEEIRKAYRALAMKYHPDRNKAKDSLQKFLEVQRAYEMLTGKAQLPVPVVYQPGRYRVVVHYSYGMGNTTVTWNF
jgi:preprotein translocase subunit Sec63